MKKNKKLKIKLGRSLRWVRSLHRLSGISLSFLIVFVTITGFLLGWKKNSFELIQKDTQRGSAIESYQFIPIQQIEYFAACYLREHQGTEISTEIKKIDIRPDKSVAKIIFEDHYWSVQIDLANGNLLSVEKRWSDLIEQLHDGSFFDDIFNLKTSFFKLTIVSLSALSLLFFCLSGFYLWAVPRFIRSYY